MLGFPYRNSEPRTGVETVPRSTDGRAVRVGASPGGSPWVPVGHSRPYSTWHHVALLLLVFKGKVGGWREGSVVKNPDSLSRGLSLGSQHSQRSSQPIPGALMPSSGLCGYCTYMVHRLHQGRHTSA